MFLWVKETFCETFMFIITSIVLKLKDMYRVSSEKVRKLINWYFAINKEIGSMIFFSLRESFFFLFYVHQHIIRLSDNLFYVNIVFLDTKKWKISSSKKIRLIRFYYLLQNTNLLVFSPYHWTSCIFKCPL